MEKQITLRTQELIELGKDEGHKIEFRVGDEKFTIITPLIPEIFTGLKKTKKATEKDVLDLARLVCHHWNPSAAIGRIVSVMDTAIKNALVAQVKATGELTQEALQAASDSYQPLEGQVGLSYEAKVEKFLTKCINEEIEKGLFEDLEDYNSKHESWKEKYTSICLRRKDAPKYPKVLEAGEGEISDAS